jgi:cell division protein FtsQ
MTSTARTDRRGQHSARSRTRRMGSWFSVLARTGRLPAFIVACSCLVLLYGFLLSGDFAVNDVTVRGAQLGDAREIAGSTGAFGASLFRVQPDRIAARLAELPYVERVVVETRLPSRVVVTITEREPALVWITVDGPLLVDRHGHILTVADNEGLPRVESDSVRLHPGEAIATGKISAVIALYEEMGRDIQAITWSQRNGLTVQRQDGRLIIFGEPDRFPLKMAVYQEVSTRETTWMVLDLREPDRPYYE